MDYDIVSSKLTHKGKILDVYEDRVVMPDGNIATREVVIRGNASAIVPVCDDGKILFVRQYRHSVKSMVLEIPAGMIDEGEEPLACAKRELEEETGFKALNMMFVTKLTMAIGMCNESVYTYIGTNLIKGVQHLDPTEFVEVESYTLDEAIAMIYSGEIIDAKTAFALLAYKDILKQFSRNPVSFS